MSTSPSLLQLHVSFNRKVAQQFLRWFSGPGSAIAQHASGASPCPPGKPCASCPVPQLPWDSGSEDETPQAIEGSRCLYRRQKGFCPSTDISAPRGYGGAGGSGTDPTRLSQPFPAPQRQGKSLSNAAGNFTVCYKNTWGWELSERFLCFLHGQLEWKWLEVSPQAHFFFFLFVGCDFWQKRIFSICIFSPLFSLSNSLCFCNEDGVWNCKPKVPELLLETCEAHYPFLQLWVDDYFSLSFLVWFLLVVVGLGVFVVLFVCLFSQEKQFKSHKCLNM